MKKLISILCTTLALASGAAHAGANDRGKTAPKVATEALKVSTAPGVSANTGKEPTGRGRGHTLLRGVVNINQADEATLELLPGVGPAKSRSIAETRARRPFKRVEDFTRVKGIGKKTLQRLRPFLAVSGASTLVEEPEAATEAE